MKLVCASNNKNKIAEIQQILLPYNIEVISSKDAGVDIEVIEDGETLEENAHKKAQAVYDICKLPTIADDSGLEVDFLNKAPGVYSARYAGENATDKDRCERVLEEMMDAEVSLRSARFVSVIYYIKDDDEHYSFEGVADGFIGYEMMGKNGFGYDYIFMVDEDTSMAMLTEKEKNEISHRAKALMKLVDFMKNDNK